MRKGEIPVDSFDSFFCHYNKNATDSFHKESAEVRIYLIFYKPNISEFISLYLCSIRY